MTKNNLVLNMDDLWQNYSQAMMQADEQATQELEALGIDAQYSAEVGFATDYVQLHHQVRTGTMHAVGEPSIEGLEVMMAAITSAEALVEQVQNYERPPTQ